MDITLLMNAKDIPNGSTVSKKTGTYTYTLLHNLKVYSDLGEKKEPLIIEGYFLTNSRGSITQIKPELELHWHTDVYTFGHAFDLDIYPIEDK